jgi:hypothetical protein
MSSKPWFLTGCLFLLLSGVAFMSRRSPVSAIRATGSPPPPSSPSPTLNPVDPVVCTADLRLAQTYEVDLDGCRLTPAPLDPSADIWFEVENSAQQYISPRNGALLHTLGEGKKRMPSPSELRNIRFDSQKIPIEELALIHVFYVKTNESRISLVRVTHLPSASEGTYIDIRVLTWR